MVHIYGDFLATVPLPLQPVTQEQRRAQSTCPYAKRKPSMMERQADVIAKLQKAIQ